MVWINHCFGEKVRIQQQNIHRSKNSPGDDVSFVLIEPSRLLLCMNTTGLFLHGYQVREGYAPVAGKIKAEQP